MIAPWPGDRHRGGVVSARASIAQINVSPQGGVPKHAVPRDTVTAGAIGENVTVVGLDWARIVPGSRLELGDQVVVEVTRYTSPCFNIKPSFSGGDYSRVSQKTHPGWSRVYV